MSTVRGTHCSGAVCLNLPGMLQKSLRKSNWKNLVHCTSTWNETFAFCAEPELLSQSQPQNYVGSVFKNINTIQ